MAEIIVEKIRNGNWVVKVDGIVRTEHSMEEGAVRVANGIIERQEAIERNQLLRSLLQGLGDFVSPTVSYESFQTAHIELENKFLQRLADGAGIYTGQSEESEG